MKFNVGDLVAHTGSPDLYYFVYARDKFCGITRLVTLLSLRDDFVVEKRILLDEYVDQNFFLITGVFR